MGNEWIKTYYAIALFGAELDEYDTPYVEVYKWELKEFIEELLEDIKYISKLNWNLTDKYNYYRALLIKSSRGLATDIEEVNIQGIENLALKLAQNY